MKISEELRIELDELQAEYNKKCFDAIVTEAEKANPYKVGDIVKDHRGSGRIVCRNIGINTKERSYTFSYRCVRLTKAMLPYKNGEFIRIYLTNIKK